MSSFQLESLRTARSANGAANTGFLHRALRLAFAIACALVLTAVLRTAEPPANWRQHLRDADAALSAGDRNRARHLYSRAARLAVWQKDWYGALAAACGMSRVERSRGDFFATRPMLIRAMILAEQQRSATGLESVADAFAWIGDDNASAMAKGRLRGAPHEADSLPLQRLACE